MVFLVIPALALLLVGCISAGTPWLATGGDIPGAALTDSRTSRTLLGNDSRGIRLFLSPRSSVNIDVECILDYVQGDPVDRPDFETDDYPMTPWLRFDFAY